MAEYKKADEIVKNMTKKFDKKYGDTTIKGIRDVFNMCLNCVNQTPTADVVEVVRCKDCKWFSVHNKDGCYRPDLDHHAQMTPVYEDDFCSYGTPKERGGEK